MHSIDPVQIIRKNGGGVSDGRPMTSENNMDLIGKAAGLLRKPLSLREILDEMLSHTLGLLKRVDRAVVILIDRETGEISEIISKFQTGIKKPYAMCGRTIVDRVVQTGTAVVMTDTQKEDFDDFSETMKLRNIRSVICLPLMSRSQVSGVLYLDSNRGPNAYRGDDLSLLTALGSTAAMAIENASLVSNE
jgi:GAF domain-containing protein